MQQNLRLSAPRPILYLLFSILVVGIFALQISRFSSIPYNRGEDWSVSWAAGRIEQDGLQPTHLFTTDYLLLPVWINWFGDTPAITRYLSALFTLLGYALFFRFALDFYGSKSAFIALFLLGVVITFQTFSSSAQPYAGMFMVTAAFHLFFLRWLKHEGCINALLSGLTLISVWDFFGAGYPFRTGLTFSSWGTLELFPLPFTLQPTDLIQMILLLALAVMSNNASTVSRSEPGVRPKYVTYPFVILLILLAVSAVTFTTAAQPVYFMIVLPLLALLAGHTIHAFPRPAQIITLALFALPMLVASPTPTLSYQEIAERALSNPENRLLISAPYTWQHIPLARYGQGRTFHALPDNQLQRGSNYIAFSSSDYFPYNRTASPDDDSTQFINYVGAAPEVWVYVENSPDDLSAAWIADLSANYAELSTEVFNLPSDVGNLRRYIRKPDTLGDLFVFGESLSLQGWQLAGSVEVAACQTISIRSWWAAAQHIPVDLSLSLVLVNQETGQGAAQNDSPPAARQTSTFITRQAYVDERGLTIPCDLAPGEYPLLMSVYQVVDGAAQNLDVTLPDGTSIGGAAYLTTLFVAGG